MKILQEIRSEDCFDGNFIKEYRMDTAVSSDFVEYLKQFGKTQVLKDLSQPFYTFDKKYFFMIKGLYHEKRIKVIFRRNNMTLVEGFLKELVEGFGVRNLEAIKMRECEIKRKLII